MKETEDTLAIKQYLLGRLELTKQEEFEHRLLTDNAYLEELLIAEDDLVDEYERNKLSSDELESFHRHFLSTPERREKLRFAKTFRKYVESSASPDSLSESEVDQSPSWFQSIILLLRPRHMTTAFSLAAALLFAVLAGSLLVRDRNLQRHLKELRAENTNSTKPLDSQSNQETQQKLALGAERNAQLNSELQRAQQQRQQLEAEIARLEKEKDVQIPPGNPSGRSFMAPVLALGGVRSGTGELQEVAIPKGAGVLNIPLSVADDKYRSYRGSLLTDSGQAIQTRNKLRPREINGQRVLVFSVPANAVSPGEFQLRLAGAMPDGRFENIGSYYFRVARQ